MLKRRAARLNLIDFIHYTLPVYDNPPHQVALAQKLEAVERGDIKNLMVIMPPRHLKSETCSIRFPAWCLGRDRQRQFIGCSHTDNLQYTFSYAIRETILSRRYQNLWPMTLDKAGAMSWQVAGKANLRDNYIAAGVGGSIMGEGADFLIVDDPLKNAEQANSQSVRDSIWQWWITTAVTRLQPGGAKILIMTRWHQDDLAGRLLKVARNDPRADQWEVLHFKAINEHGEALWPDKFPVWYLEKIRSGQVDDPDEPGKGSRAFEALYQGNPSIAAGNIIKREWWKFYREPPSFSQTVHSWDTAFKVRTENDFSVCTVWGVAANGYYLLDVWRRRVEFPELKRAVNSLYERDRPSAVLVEDKASGQSLIQELQRDSRAPVLPVKVDSDKVARVNSSSYLIEAGKVFLPERAAWLHDYIEEMSAFPNGEYDDQVDSTTQFLNKLVPVGPVELPALERRPEFSGIRGRTF